MFISWGKKIIKCKKDHVWWCFFIRFAKLEGNFNNRGRIRIRFLNTDPDPFSKYGSGSCNSKEYGSFTAPDPQPWNHAYVFFSWLAWGGGLREISFINMSTAPPPVPLIAARNGQLAITKQETGSEDRHWKGWRHAVLVARSLFCVNHLRQQIDAPWTQSHCCEATPTISWAKAAVSKCWFAYQWVPVAKTYTNFLRTNPHPNQEPSAGASKIFWLICNPYSSNSRSRHGFLFWSSRGSRSGSTLRVPYDNEKRGGS